MDISTATKKAMLEGKGITRPNFSGLILIPTNTAYGFIGCSCSKELKEGWQPKADDLTADDWNVAVI